MSGKNKGLILSNVLNSYLFLMFCIYPFYVEDGYYNIGIAKNNFFCVISIVIFMISMIALVIYIFDLKKQRKTFVERFERKGPSITEKSLFLYMVVVLISFVFSPYKQTTLWGTEGWYLGTIPLLLMAAFAFLLAHFWKEEKWILYGSMIVSAIVFVLGICNRFSFYPVAIEPHNPTFISTLGNINWFCGYMSVTAPIGVGIYILTDNKKYKYSWIKWLLIAYVYIAFMAGFSQGSSSVFLWEGAMFAAFLWIAVKNTARIKNWLLMIVLWGMAGQTVRRLKYIFAERYNYDSALLVDTNVTLIIAIVAFMGYFCMCAKIKEDKLLAPNLGKVIRMLIGTALITGIVLWVVLSVCHTRSGIGFLQNSDIFLWNENWGNGRGASIKSAFLALGEMSFLQKLLGVGADGFCEFVYSIPQIQEYLTAYFGESFLTNAHNESITNLVNLGVLGTMAFTSVLLTFVYRCMTKGEEEPVLYIFAVCVLCYIANNLISFAQILNIPFLFLILGMGEYYLRKNFKEKK